MEVFRKRFTGSEAIDSPNTLTQAYSAVCVSAVSCVTATPDFVAGAHESNIHREGDWKVERASFPKKTDAIL
jgi:hypothetical protein